MYKLLFIIILSMFLCSCTHILQTEKYSEKPVGKTSTGGSYFKEVISNSKPITYWTNDGGKTWYRVEKEIK